ncbi:helix-turn-helix domain-containing protein [Lentzea sp. NPDC059081]|uniref:helix-turn-helix domain-containing protein n=1 Tax=Lentzea sp. NPDC059081 TaxID=3346719 RepID=UPI0036C4C494
MFFLLAFRIATRRAAEGDIRHARQVTEERDKKSEMPTYYAEILGRELRSMRERTGYLQSQASLAAGMSTPTVSRYENALELPCLTRVVQLAGIYRDNPQALLVRAARLAPCFSRAELGMPKGRTVLSAGITHYLAGVRGRLPRGWDRHYPDNQTSLTRNSSRALPQGKSYSAVLANELLKIRSEKNVDQYYVSRELGVTQSVVSHWERGDVIPTLPLLVRLVNKVYGLCAQELLIEVCRSTVWDPDVAPLKIPQGLQILGAVPEKQPVLAALVAYDLGTRIPSAARHTRKSQGAARGSSHEGT